MTEQKRKPAVGAVFVLTIAVVVAVGVLIHSNQADQPAGTSSLQSDTSPSSSPTLDAALPSADPTPVASTTASAPFVLTSSAQSAELNFIVMTIRAGGHMDTDAVLYTPNGQVEGVLCRDGYFSDNPVDVHQWVANYAVCDDHGGHAVLPAPVRLQASAGVPPNGNAVGVLGTLCADGSLSGSTGRGTCSHHGGEAH